MIKIIMAGSLVVLLILGLAVGVMAELMPYPWHASCKIEWTFNEACPAVRNRIVSQINQWQGDSNCGQVSDSCPNMPCGQKCLYELVSQTDNKIVATHTTPVARYIDDMTFEFSEENNKCKVQAFSTSRLWYAILDFGTNYCNLKNLLEGYTSDQFTEVTEDNVCTQYSSRDCSRF